MKTLKVMSRASTIFLVVAIGAGIYFLFKDAPVSRELGFDLGSGHTDVERLEVVFRNPEGQTVRRVEWKYGKGEAPRTIRHELVLPADDLKMTIYVEFENGDIIRDERLITAECPRKIVFYPVG